MLVLIGEALCAALADLPNASSSPAPLHAPFDVATLSGLLASALPAATAAATAAGADALTALPLDSIVSMVLGKLEAGVNVNGRSALACRAELAMLHPLFECCATLDAALHAQPIGGGGTAAGSIDNGPSRSEAELVSVRAALDRGVSAMLSHATGLLPQTAGGGVACVGASSLLLAIASRRWPPSVHEAGGLRALAAVGGSYLSDRTLRIEAERPSRSSRDPTLPLGAALPTRRA